MITAKSWQYVQRFVGEPKLNDFKLVSVQLPLLQENEVLVEAKFLSVDPYMRLYMDRFYLGATMIGSQVATVLESRCPQFHVGDHVFGLFGWQTHTIFNPAQCNDLVKPFVMPSLGRRSLSLGVGVLGITGLTAYFGMLEICRPLAGEVLVVSGAGGGVGSVVGQIGKIYGCTVIGIAGTAAKCRLLRAVLRFDHCIDYRGCPDVAAELRRIAPGGIDCYFDNVGGALSQTIIRQMKPHGRVVCCGSISTYNSQTYESLRRPTIQLSSMGIYHGLRVEGFMLMHWADRWMEGVQQLLFWLDAGLLRSQETMTMGFEKMPQAFIGMLRGLNVGKAVVRV